MKLQNLYFSFLKSIGIAGAVAILFSFSIIDAAAQGGTGRITPLSGGVTKKKVASTIKKVTTIPKKATTTSRQNKTKVTSTAKNYTYYYNLGQAAYNKKDLAGAVANYTQAIKLNPKSADAYYNRGLAYYDDENYPDAIYDYTQSIRLNPQADAYNNRGLAYEYNGNRNQAASDYRMALRLNPGYDLAQQNLDRVEGDDDSGNNSTAGSKNKTKPNSNSSNDADYYAGLADDYYDKRDFDNALINYTKAINLAPGEAGSYVRRGFIYHYTGKVTEAYDDYNTAVRLDTALKNEPYIKCMLYSVTAANANTVINDCTKTINEFPGFSLAYYKRGVAYRELKNYAPAMNDFTKSIDLYPQFFNSIIYRGLIYEAQSNPSAAITEYTRAIQLAGVNNSKAFLAYNNRGVAYEMQGNLSQAAADYRKSYQLNPNFTTAKDNLDSVLKKQKATN